MTSSHKSSIPLDLYQININKKYKLKFITRHSATHSKKKMNKLYFIFSVTFESVCLNDMLYESL